MVRRGADARGLKVNEAAARHLRSGHPWVFRESVRREVEGLEPGASIRVLDLDGRPLGWGLVEPQGAIAARIVSTDPDFVWGEAAVVARVDQALEIRRRLLGPEVETAIRLIHGEGDGLPGLAVDRLGDFLLIYKYSRAADAFIESVQKHLFEQVKPEGIYVQDRTRTVAADQPRPGSTLVLGKAAPPELTVGEDGLKFVVDVTAPVSPGLFLDLREGRRLFERLAPGRRVLSLFSYTGAFGVRAVRAGAAYVANVDAASRSHARCRQNLVASGLDAEACDPLSGDVFKHLERLRRLDERFDLVVVDPPPFSSVKDNAVSALRDWEELVAGIVKIMSPGGEVLAISNAAKLSEDELLSAIGSGALRGGREVRVIGELGLPPDFPVPPAFPEGHYLEVKRLLVL